MGFVTECRFRAQFRNTVSNSVTDRCAASSPEDRVDSQLVLFLNQAAEVVRHQLRQHFCVDGSIQFARYTRGQAIADTMKLKTVEVAMLTTTPEIEKPRVCPKCKSANWDRPKKFERTKA